MVPGRRNKLYLIQMENNFKVGDKILCIEGAKSLKVHNIYNIKELKDCVLVVEQLPELQWFYNRFITNNEQIPFNFGVK